MANKDEKAEAKAESNEPKTRVLLLSNQNVETLQLEINIACENGYDFHSIAATYGKFCAVLKLA